MKRGHWLVAVLAALALYGSAAGAADQIFYDGPQWQVTLVDSHATTTEAPYCAIRTTLWSSKFVSIEMPLQGIDQIGIAIRIQKNGWALPVDDSTDFGFVVGPLGAQFTAKAASKDTLYSLFDPETPSGGWVLLDRLAGAVFSNRKPFALKVAFQGNEEPWLIPRIAPIDGHRINNASRECQAVLNQMGPEIFGSVANDEGTSPFGDKQDQAALRKETQDTTDVSAGEKAAKNEAKAKVDQPSDNRWTFTHHEEDWGNVCVVEVAQDSFQIGFMATPGLDKIAYIEGLDTQSANAVWQVDANKAYPLRGTRSDYFGFLAFDIPSPNFIEELMQGTTLKISVIGKAKISLSVSSARDVFAKFVQCHLNNGAASSTAVE